MVRNRSGVHDLVLVQLPGLQQRRGWCGRFVEGSEQGLVIALMEQGLLPAAEQFLGAGIGLHHHKGGGLNPHQVSGGLGQHHIHGAITLPPPDPAPTPGKGRRG